LRATNAVKLTPGSRFFLRDLTAAPATKPEVLASGCKALREDRGDEAFTWMVEGVSNTPAVLLLRVPKAPRSVTLAGQVISGADYSSADGLLWIRFPNEAAPRELRVAF
jgi:hypothetical protein